MAGTLPLPASPSKALRRTPPHWKAAVAVGVAALALVGMFGAGPARAAPTHGPITSTPASETTLSGSGFSLGISASPSTICSGGSSACAAGTGIARVTLSATVAPGPGLSWPTVQVVFLLETTPYDGAFDPTSPGGEPGYDRCAAPAYSGRTLCEESNAVPFFEANAGAIASRIQAAHPSSQVSFGLIDFASTGAGPWDDGDGSAYHVDVGSFVPAGQFGSAVTSSLGANVLGGGWTVPDSDLRDNFLDSPIATTLYGALEGSGLDWSNSAHHVLVWIGSTAPRDPHYLEDYCVSPHVLSLTENGSGCLTSPCEPSYNFGAYASPDCLGWVTSHDGNPADSIVAVAHQSASCAGSEGGSCTIDVVDLPTTPTDPNSFGWPNRTLNGTSDRALVQSDVAHVITAGCDLAGANGGSWAGPVGTSCPAGGTGTLPYLTSLGPTSSPDLANPALLDALGRVGFGAVTLPVSARGSGLPMFSFVPASGVAPASPLEASTACVHNGSLLPTCPVLPDVLDLGGRTVLAWNWSTVAARNVLYGGDRWTASFDLVATSPPDPSVALDACSLPACLLANSGPHDGWSTRALFLAPGNSTPTSDSFPLATLRVEATSSPALPGTGGPPGPTGVPPSPIVPGPIVIPGIQPAAPGPSVSIANVSVQALAAGAIAAGLARMAVRTRAVAVAHATPAAGRGPPEARSGRVPDAYRPPP